MSDVSFGYGRSNFDAYLALAIGIVIIGWSPILMVWAGAPGVATAFFRTAIAVVVLALPFWRKRRSVGRMTRSSLWLAILAGICYSVDMGLWATGVTMSGAANPTLLANTAPVWVGIGAMLFFRERLGIGFWVGLALAMSGAALILRVDHWHSVMKGTGSVYGLLAGIFYGGFFLAGQKARERLDTLSFFWITAVVTASVLGVSTLLLGQPVLGYATSTYLIFLVLGLITQVGGWLAINYALGLLPASTVSPMMLVQPLITAGLAHFLLGEHLVPWQLLGGTVVILGVLLVHRQRMGV